MKDRRPLLAANWKMNPAPLPMGASPGQIPECYKAHGAVDVVVFPSFLDIPRCVAAGLSVGAQYGRAEPSGAFTGDVSIAMIKAAGCRYVLCGHSERRRYHKETDDEVAAQAVAALELGLHPIVCVGETLTEREAGKEKAVVKRQLSRLLPQSKLLTIAYEPVWAIGTGKNATPKEAQEMHAYIRGLLPREAKNETRILYGGSANGLNAKDLLTQPDVDGLLVGGASLKVKEFGDMVAVAL